MTENENYVQGQEIEPISDTRVYVHKDVLKYLDLYQELGTIPQLRALNDERDKYLLMCREYSAIGTVEEFKILKEKAEPKKIAYQIGKNGLKHEKCPSCGSFRVFGNYCTECGQKLYLGKGE